MLWAEKLVCILTCEKGNKSTSNYSCTCIKYFKCSFMVWTLSSTKRVIVDCFVGKIIDLQWRLGRKTHNNHKRFIWIKKRSLRNNFISPHLNQDCKKKLLIVWNPFIFSAHFNQVFFIYYYNKICILSTQNYCEDHIIISFFLVKEGH